MNRADAIGLGAAAVAVVATLAIEILLFEVSTLHTGALLAVSVGTGTLAWLVTRRGDLTAVAVATVAVWALPHAAGGRIVAAGLVPLAIAAAPLHRVPIVRRTGATLLGAGAAILVTWFLLMDPTAALIALVVAGAAAWLIPTHPTHETVRGTRAVAVFLPAAALAAALTVNAVTGRLDQGTVRDDLAFAVSIVALLSMAGLAILGWSVLMASTSPYQGTAWVSLGAVAGLIVGSAVLTDPLKTTELGAVATGPVAVLATVAAARARATLPGGRMWLVLPPTLALLQFGVSF